jgi:hypothetical protein
MAKGEYCVKHGRYFGNVVPCPLCADEHARERGEPRYNCFCDWCRAAREYNKLLSQLGKPHLVQP